jgi:hypothetical protein
MVLKTKPHLKKIKADKLTASLLRPTGCYKGYIKPLTKRFNIGNYEVTAIENCALIFEIKSSKEETAEKKMEIFFYIMYLIQLAEGYYPYVDEIEWTNSTESVYKLSNEDYNKAFVHFPTNQEYICNELRLVPVFDIFQMVDETTYKSYQKFKEELNIQLNLFHLACSDNKLFVDLRCAFFIELFEPLTQYEGLVGEREPLKQSISSFILHYGGNLFDTEISRGIDFIPLMVKSRVGVMHATLSKKKKQGLTPHQCTFYNLKLQLLFRSYFIHKLGIDISPYKGNLKKAIAYAEKPMKDYDLISSFTEKEKQHEQAEI